MTTMNDFFKTDLIDDHHANDVNVLMAAALRSEYTNTETITATKELDNSDCPFQILTASGDQTVELAPEDSSNHATIIYNVGTSKITVKDDSGATTFAVLFPAQWALFFPVSGTTWKALETANQYTLYAAAAGATLNDATTYYFGSQMANIATTQAGRRKVYFPRSGIVKRVDLIAGSNTVASNEAFSIYFRLNDTTDTLLTNAADFSLAPYTAAISTNIVVVEGDFFEIKIVTPTWATNPVSTSMQAQIFVG